MIQKQRKQTKLIYLINNKIMASTKSTYETPDANLEIEKDYLGRLKISVVSNKKADSNKALKQSVEIAEEDILEIIKAILNK